MKRLHNSYGNLQAWRGNRCKEAKFTKVVFDWKRTIFLAVSIVAFCAYVSSFCWERYSEQGLKILFWFSILIGVLVPLILILWVIFERSKDDLITYDHRNDCISFPRIDLIVVNARGRVSFSFEHYTDGSDHFFEFNLVVDRERVAFLSSSVSNGFDEIIKEVEYMGFLVTRTKIGSLD